jgi:hypothetical protein
MRTVKNEGASDVGETISTLLLMLLEPTMFERITVLYPIRT